MKSQEKIKNIPPDHGWIKEIARIVGCSTKTVSNAVYRNTKGVKATRARQVYAAKYGSKNQ